MTAPLALVLAQSTPEKTSSAAAVVFGMFALVGIISILALTKRGRRTLMRSSRSCSASRSRSPRSVRLRPTGSRRSPSWACSSPRSCSSAALARCAKASWCQRWRAKTLRSSRPRTRRRLPIRRNRIPVSSGHRIPLTGCLGLMRQLSSQKTAGIARPCPLTGRVRALNRPNVAGYPASRQPQCAMMWGHGNPGPAHSFRPQAAS